MWNRWSFLSHEKHEVLSFRGYFEGDRGWKWIFKVDIHNQWAKIHHISIFVRSLDGPFNSLRIVSSTPPLIGLRQKLTLSLNFLARRTTGSNLRLSSPVHKAWCIGAQSLSPSWSNSNILKKMKMIVTNYNLQAVDSSNTHLNVDTFSTTDHHQLTVLKSADSDFQPRVQLRFCLY